MPRDADLDPELARYSRQLLFAPLGVAGQRRLRQATVTLIGCGALGSALANLLVRAGVGALRIVDRDFIELNNLQRQTLFDEHDIAQNLPKAEAAVRKLHKINSAVELEGLVSDVHAGNIADLCRAADLILDGTDNLETRYLINDFAVRADIPWVYGACLAASGLVLPVRPHQTPCLRCLWENPPAPGTTPTCDTAGILAATANIVASLQATEAMKLLIGSGQPPIRPADAARSAPTGGRLFTIDVWAGRMRTVNVQAAFDEGDCPCCRQGRYEFLSGARTATSTTLCGRDAVQILPADTGGTSVSGGAGVSGGTGVSPVADAKKLSFKAIADRLPPRSNPKWNEFMLKFTVEGFAVTLFPDGRAIIQGTSDPAIARGVYAKYIGI